MALLVLGTVFVANAVDTSEKEGEEVGCAADGEAQTEGGCNHFCHWCGVTEYSCNSGGSCC